MADDVDPNKLEIADELIAERRSALPGELPDDMNPKHRAIIGFIDTLNDKVGKTVCWLIVPLCLSMVYEVIARKFGIVPSVWWSELVRVFSGSDAPSEIIPAPTMWAYDISRMVYGAMFMLGAGYALSRGVHIRADFLYRNWSDRTQGIVDLILYCTLFTIGMLGLMYSGTEYWWGSFSRGSSCSDQWYCFFLRGERAGDTAWMPYVHPVRFAIPLGAFLLLIQGLSEGLKSWYAATRGRWPV